MRFLLATLWVITGGALTAGVYWVFLITPESTVWTLIASALLAIIALAVAGFTASGTIAMWSYGPSMAGIRRAIHAIAGVIPAALIVWILWWLTTHAEVWVTMRSGQINAMFIARFGWDDVRWMFSAVHYALWWVRWVVASMLALSLIAGFVAIGWSALAQAAWLRRALRPPTLAVATFWFVLLIAAPWIYLVPWRPKQVPATSIEFAFIVAKLSVTAILFAIGVALVANEASRVPDTPTDPSTAVAAA